MTFGVCLTVIESLDVAALAVGNEIVSAIVAMPTTKAINLFFIKEQSQFRCQEPL